MFVIITPYRLVRLLFGLAIVALSIAVHADAARDYEVQAASLYHFLKFADWPSQAFQDGSPINVCTVGGDPFFGNLDKMAERRAKNRIIAVNYLHRRDLPGNCHLLFVGKAEQAHLATIIAQVSSSAIITVSDINNFARRGGMIGFVTKGNRLRLEINLSQLRKANIKVSSNLLEIATIVGGNEIDR